MKKRIFLYMLAANFLVIIIMATLLSFIFYGFFSTNKSTELRQSTLGLANIMETQQEKLLFLHQLDIHDETNRITLVNASGKVLFDSHKGLETLDNHSDRPEISRANANGQGEYKRFSATFGEETYYYAIKLADGNILRLAKTTNSIQSIFMTLLPWLFFCLIITSLFSLIIAQRLTKKIVAPINKLDLERVNANIYEELTPFVEKIENQRKQIITQIAELEKHSNTIQTIIKDMHEGIILIDSNQCILSVNQSALSIFEEKEQDFTGKNILELTRNPLISENIKLALAGQALNSQLPIDKKEFEVFFDPVNDNQKVIGLIILFLDVTSKNAAEKMRREFSANVSHELKTPLTTILGYSEIIETGMAKSGDIKLFAGKIKGQVINLVKIIENIIKISQLDEKTTDKEFEKFDFVKLINEVIENFQETANNNNISLQPVVGQLYVKSDKTMIRELLSNLIDNAIKYNKPDGKIEVDFKEESGKLLISIKDTGIGIAEDKLSRVFERFYRVDPSRSKKTGGTGLGLSIVKHIAQYHNGEVTLQSEPDEGTTVSLLLDILN